MGIIILIGMVYMLADGNWLGCLIFLGIVAMARDNYTDSNRRGGWWK